MVTKVESSGTIMAACSTEMQELLPLLLLLVFKASKAPKSAVPAGKHRRFMNPWDTGNSCNSIAASVLGNSKYA